MKAKKILWSILLVLFSLILLADLALVLFVPEETEAFEPSALQMQNDRSESGKRAPFSEEEASSFGKGGFMQGTGDVLPQGGQPPFGNGEFSPPENGFAKFEPSENDSTERRGSGRRARSGEAENAFPTEPIASDESTAASTPFMQFLSVARAVRPYWLWILICAAAGVIGCIVRWIFLSRESRIQKATQIQEADEPLPSRKKQAIWPAILLLLAALVLVAVLFPAGSSNVTNEAVALSEVRVGTVETGSLSNPLMTMGYLAEQKSVAVTLPASVKLIAVAVQNGDAVVKNQILAKADRTSVMVAVAAVQEAIEAIDAELQTEQSAKTATTLTAPAAGTVKAVYASVGDHAEDVMAAYGALMLLSLDGRMSVDLSTQDGLHAGDSLIVTLSDGTAIQGEVTDLTDDTVTVSVYDNRYPIGESVSVTDANGTLFGSGRLYVHRPLKILGYLGTVSRIYRAEGSSVTSGASLIALTDVIDSAKTLTLLEQRA